MRIIFRCRRRWRRDLGDPELGILSLNIVEHEGSDEYNGRGKEQDRQEVPSQSPDMLIDTGEQCGCASWWMRGLG